ncbi:hypothetical protein DVH24_005691 [Malus domestica]|uniref:Uncharacterized protein n=1 Tax=Malus domestica TaxID=3750 RepID=A0A498IIP8_MALDO|nr:hypothetical protein DVH24_005691 [Malus domestica]
MHVIHPDWLCPQSRRVLINCEGFTQVHRFKLSFNVASSLEVLFLHPRVVSLTDKDAQVLGLVKCGTNPIVRVPQVAELGDLPKEVIDKVSNQTSKQAT